MTDAQLSIAILILFLVLIAGIWIVTSRFNRRLDRERERDMETARRILGHDWNHR